MQTLNNVHQQFASFFKSELLQPFAFLVSKKLSEGNICVPIDDAEAELAESSFYNAAIVATAKNKLVTEPLVSRADGPTQPFVLHNNRLYLRRYFAYETQILEKLKAFIAAERDKEEERKKGVENIASFISGLFDGRQDELSANGEENVDWQLVAAISGVLNNFTIITGGPGTGKTTTVARLLAILFTVDPTLKVALAAPTGKAAVRMAESLKKASSAMPASVSKKFEELVPGTIHRLLGYKKDSPYFKHNSDNPLNYDVVIVDESSMIDVALFAKLLSAITNDTRLILLGDKEQLASVEAGSLFGDLCKSQATFSISADRAELINSLINEKDKRITADYISNESFHLLFEHIVELKKSHRFSGEKGIGRFSKAVINNRPDELITFLQNNDVQVMIDTMYDSKVFETFVRGYSAYIRETDIKAALTKLNELRVLCAIREGEHGLYNINKHIEKYLQQLKLIKPLTDYYENRPIIVTRNYYDLGLFNGDVGIIRPDENGVLKAWFEDASGELKNVLPGFISEAETTFAMTIHKSQGSEYDHVLVILPSNASIPVLTAELLYTGITRAKTKVIVQATEEVILETAKRRVKRASGIMERFAE